MNYVPKNPGILETHGDMFKRLGAEPDQDALAQSAWAARFNISPHPLRRGDSEAARRMIADDRGALLLQV